MHHIPPLEQEIDLYSMLASMVQRITAPFRYWRVGLVALVLGLVIGYLHYSTTPKRYAASIVLSGNDLATDQTMVLLLDELNNLCSKGAHTQLADKLNIQPVQAAALRSVAAREVKDLPTNPYPSEREVVVEVHSAADSTFYYLGQQLVYYIEHAPALSELKHSRQESQNFALNNLLGQLRQMDSAARNTPQATAIYAQMAEHQARITALREDMARNKISIIRDFSVPVGASWPRLWVSLVVALAGCYALCVVWLIRKP